MTMDQSKLGQVVAEQMEAIEEDHGEECEIGDVCVIVEVLLPGGVDRPRPHQRPPSRTSASGCCCRRCAWNSASERADAALAARGGRISNNRGIANPDRLTALDSTFLHLEDHSPAHMHVASVMVFEGAAPTHRELVEHVESRLHLVPRYRQRLAYVPLGQGRPCGPTTRTSTPTTTYATPRCRGRPTTPR